jgi:hypothetical protein
MLLVSVTFGVIWPRRRGRGGSGGALRSPRRCLSFRWTALPYASAQMPEPTSPLRIADVVEAARLQVSKALLSTIAVPILTRRSSTSGPFAGAIRLDLRVRKGRQRILRWAS